MRNRILNRIALGLALGLTVSLVACAHSYVYTPEIAGPGATYGGDGIIFAVPDKSPLLILKIVARGKSAPGVFEIDYYFFNPKGLSAGKDIQPQMLFDPSDQRMSVWGVSSQPLSGRTAYESHIDKEDARVRKVRLYFQVPDREKDINSFLLTWSVHPKGMSSTSQTVRFDRHSGTFGTGGGGGIPGDNPASPPYHESSIPPTAFEYWP